MVEIPILGERTSWYRRKNSAGSYNNPVELWSLASWVKSWKMNPGIRFQNLRPEEQMHKAIQQLSRRERSDDFRNSTFLCIRVQYHSKDRVSGRLLEMMIDHIRGWAILQTFYFMVR